MKLTYRFIAAPRGRHIDAATSATERALRAAEAYAATSRSDYEVVARGAGDDWVDIAFDIPGFADPRAVGDAWQFALAQCGVEAHVRDANRLGA